jgi:hypothetical protein
VTQREVWRRPRSSKNQKNKNSVEKQTNIADSRADCRESLLVVCCVLRMLSESHAI